MSRRTTQVEKSKVTKKKLNTPLHNAKSAKKDEFYTQLPDIVSELRHYRSHLRGKTIFCNCDDPYESKFFEYFAGNFNALGLKKLITTSYNGSPVAGKQLSLFGIEGLKGNKKGNGPYVVEIDNVPDMNKDGAVGIVDVKLLLEQNPEVVSWLREDGDFRGDECVDLLKRSDIVITNPPFSLFREYISQLMKHKKKFLILGQQNAITYVDVFSLIKENKVWLGVDNGGTKWFKVPDDYDIQTESRKKIESGVKYFSMGSIVWFTNLDHKKRHETIPLYKLYNPSEYPTYDNYNAIEVSRVSEIPVDYFGPMGVPVTFLDKYNPKQFEIIGSFNGGTHGEELGARKVETICANGKASMWNGPVVNKRQLYKRIIIKRKVKQ